jgi:hypothetical protein
MLPRRVHVLRWLHRIPTVAIANDIEVLTLIDQKRLWGTGIGWVDAHLLAAGLISGSELWTLDQRLQAAAERLGLAFSGNDLVQ